MTKVEQNGFEFVYGEGAWHLVGYPEKSERIVLPSIVDAGGHSFDRYEIYDRLFYGDVAVKDIVVPTSVTRIGEQTFSDCAALAAYAIYNCDVLEEIKLHKRRKYSGVCYKRLRRKELVDFQKRNSSFRTQQSRKYSKLSYRGILFCTCFPNATV